MRSPAQAPSSQWNVPMLFGGIDIALSLEHAQGSDQLGAGLARLDDVIHPTAFGGDVGGGEAPTKFLHLLAAQFFRISRFLKFAPVDNVHCALRAHHGDLGARVSEIHISSDVF